MGVHSAAPGRGIHPECFYSRRDVVAELQVSSNTITAWIADGLACYGWKTKTDLFLGRDLIQFHLARPKSKEGVRSAARKAAATRWRRKAGE